MKPKLEIQLLPIFSSNDLSEILNVFKMDERTSQFYVDSEMKYQAIRMKLKRRLIHQLKVKVALDGESTYLILGPREPSLEPRTITFRFPQSIALVPEEERVIPIWYAIRKDDKSQLYLNTETTMPMDLGIELEPLRLDLSFIYEDGVCKTKPTRFHFHVSAWDRLGLEPLER